jgi:hypothetical protein
MLRLSIQSKILLVFMLLFTAAFSVIFFWFYQFTTNLVMNNLRQSLMSSASMAASLISADAHTSVYASGVEDSPEYIAIANQLRLVRAANPLLAAVYTMVKSPNPNELIFVVSADEDPETRAHLGEPYDTSNAPEMMPGFDGRSADIEYGTDEYGNWLSGYAPIRDAQGNGVAIVGVDMTADDVFTAQRNIRNISLLGFVIMLGGVFAASYLLSDALTHSLEKITETACSLEKDEPFDPQCLASVVRGSDEVAQLARVFSRMAVQIQARVQELKHTVTELRIEIDEAKRALDVSNITDSEGFQDLVTRAKALRQKRNL